MQNRIDLIDTSQVCLWYANVEDGWKETKMHKLPYLDEIYTSECASRKAELEVVNGCIQ